MSELKFTFSLDKLIYAIAFFATRGIPDLTKLKVAKLLFFADKDHLLQFGRPIIGDEYFCLPYGPVPSVSLNEMNDAINAGDLESSDDVQADAICFASVLKVHRPFFGKWLPVFRARKGYDAQVFSKSELSSLQSVSDQFGKMTASDLVTLTHKEVAWMIPNRERRNGGRARIPYELFFHDADAQAKEVLAFAREEQKEQRALDSFMRDISISEAQKDDANSGTSRTALQGAL